ncbi:MAG: hypothetical protein R3288_15135 [Woeseiaceae bacterium]|nr:hypothetical protein [Woeseiaceae bacterium]
MRLLFLGLAALAMLPSAAGEYAGLASVDLSVLYVDEDDRPMDDSYLPKSVGLRIKPIPGSMYGSALDVSVLDVVADESGMINLDLLSIGDTLDAIALPIVPVGEFETLTIDPPDVRVVRLGTFAYALSDFEIEAASTGLRVVDDDSLAGQSLVYFDRPARIAGDWHDDDHTTTYDVQIHEAGVAWVEFADLDDKRVLVTERRAAGREALTIYVRELTYLPVVREQGGYRLFDEVFANDELGRLPASLSKYPGKQVLVTGETNVTLGDMLTLLPVLHDAGYQLLFRDGDGNVHPVDVEEGF